MCTKIMGLKHAAATVQPQSLKEKLKKPFTNKCISVACGFLKVQTQVANIRSLSHFYLLHR